MLPQNEFSTMESQQIYQPHSGSGLLPRSSCPTHNVFSEIFEDFLFGFELFWHFFVYWPLALICFDFQFLGDLSIHVFLVYFAFVLVFVLFFLRKGKK